MGCKLVIFDFDGTLADTSMGIVATMEQVFLRMGVAVPEERVMKGVIGLPLLTALQRAGSLSDVEALRAVDLYKGLFLSVELGCVKLFSGVSETLAALREKEVPMAIATSRNRESLDEIMRRHGLSDSFGFVATVNDGYAHKPAPDMVFAALNRFGVRADEALVVGDTTFDLEMGRRAGCRTCGVTYGNHSRDMLLTAAPDFLIDKFVDIKDVVLCSC